MAKTKWAYPPSDLQVWMKCEKGDHFVHINDIIYIFDEKTCETIVSCRKCEGGGKL